MYVMYLYNTSFFSFIGSSLGKQLILVAPTFPLSYHCHLNISLAFPNTDSSEFVYIVALKKNKIKKKFL